MMKRFRWSILLAAMLLGACSASLEEQQDEIIEAAGTEFASEPEETNHSSQDIDFHLPFGIEKEDETPNNILLKNGSKTYILFYNQHEPADSKVVYESTLKQHADWDVNRMYEQDGKFGYLLIKELPEESYQVVTGVGGVKVTTETKNLKSDVPAMMNIANSAKVK
ncbi:hypothetical protein WQ57_09415 [Mesobacillus campisalis]|uniref:Lipoprotein n=2 Tax=Mesobacillus campisalis TaxID=1408103 RepID=A0A0M2T0U2_9BACI|nr:hypothetical protein WQ57_09415 [Mesobacillus campisalis]